MSASNTSNAANGPAVIIPKANPNIIDRALALVTDAAHYVLRLYFLVILLIYFWLVKIFTRAVQPLEPLLKQMQKIPAEDVNAEGIRNQLARLLGTVLLYLAPLVKQVFAFVTRPLVWARDKVVQYVDQENETASKPRSPKDS